MPKPKIKDIVYLVTDPELLPRMIVKYEVSEAGRMYNLACGSSSSWHSKSEFTDKKPTTKNKPGFGSGNR